MDGPRPALPLQQAPAQLGRAALPDGRVRHLRRRRGYGAALPLRPVELGNLYDGSYRRSLGPRGCPADVCDCHIGYVHLETLPLYDVFAGGVLERIPARRQTLDLSPVRLAER